MNIVQKELHDGIYVLTNFLGVMYVRTKYFLHRNPVQIFQEIMYLSLQLVIFESLHEHVSDQFLNPIPERQSLLNV